MPPCRGPRLTDIAIVSPANDNYTPINPSMKSFEAGSVLAQSDYTKRSQLRPIVSIGLTAILLTVAFIVPLLK
jgi:hypothetical protein